MRTLRALIEMEAPMRPARAIDIALRLLDALRALHASGRAHGDVCAERVMIDARGVRMLPPEPARARDATQRGDITRVASILYELLTRAPPEDEGPASHHTPARLSERLVDIVDRTRNAHAGDVATPKGVDALSETFALELRVCLIDALSQARRERP